MRRRNAGQGRLWPRIALAGCGLIIALYGLERIDRGIWVYSNGTYRAAVYSAGTVAVGGLLSLLAMIPDSLVAFLLIKKGAGQRMATRGGSRANLDDGGTRR